MWAAVTDQHHAVENTTIFLQRQHTQVGLQGVQPEKHKQTSSAHQIWQQQINEFSKGSEQKSDMLDDHILTNVVLNTLEITTFTYFH